MATTRTRARQPGRERVSAAGALAQRKLRAFARIEPEFIACFRFVEEIHGQRRFESLPIADLTRYLHALWVCELKDRLLSVPHSIARYEGARALGLLRDWQEGQTAGVVAFIHRRLDDQPFAELTRQIESSRMADDLTGAARLTSGRGVLLNRLFTLAHALDAIFALEPERLRAEVIAGATALGHTRAQIDRQLTSLSGDLYAYVPHPTLARRNMLLMNGAGLRISDTDGDRPGERTARVQPGAPPAAAYAESPIAHERTQLSLRWRVAR